MQGQELIEGRAFLDACEAKWLVTLVEFNNACAFEIDGHVSCVAWLVERCGMGRSTAKEKLRTAMELDRRPVIRDAFLDGKLSYSKARALTRLVGLNDGRDQSFVEEFADETVDMLERLVRWWNERNGDEPKPRDPYDVPRFRFQPGFGGAMGRIIIDGANEDLARIMNVNDSYGSFLFFNARAVDEASVKPRVLRADNSDEPAKTIDEALGIDTTNEPWDPETVPPASASEPPMSLAERRFEWFIDLIEEIALVRRHQLDPQRASVAVTVPYESLFDEKGVAVLDTGSLVTGEAVRRLCCDAEISRMVVDGPSQILDIGRETRTWNRAQRRAARFRHGNQCAVRGCDRRITEIHHLVFWRNGGETCIENAIPLCSRHHHMVHDGGWTIDWNVKTGITTFAGPLGQVLQSETDPFLVRPPAFAA